MLPTFFDNLSLLSFLNLFFLSGGVCIFCKRVRVGMNCSEMEECLCSLNRLFKHFTAVPTLANGSLPTHIHGWQWTFSKRGNSRFWTCCALPGWAPEDSPFIWQESNLVVWAHLEFVSTDNLDISWPTNNHKRSFYIYWEWTSSHALLGFLLGGRNSRTTYPSPAKLLSLFRLKETWRSFFSLNLFITESSGIFRICLHWQLGYILANK